MKVAGGVCVSVCVCVWRGVGWGGALKDLKEKRKTQCENGKQDVFF